MGRVVCICIFFVLFVNVWGFLLIFKNTHCLYFNEPTKHALSSPGIFEEITKTFSLKHLVADKSLGP